MTRPRLSRAERLRLAQQWRAEDSEQRMTMIERDIATIQQLAATALMTKVAYSEEKIPEARCEAIMACLNREREAMRAERERPDPVGDQPDLWRIGQ